jgi:hypothetical protein
MADAAASVLDGGRYGGRRRARWNSQPELLSEFAAGAADDAGVGGDGSGDVDGAGDGVLLRASDGMGVYKSSVQWRALSDSLVAASEPLPTVVGGGFGAVVSPGSSRLVAAVAAAAAAAAAVGSGGSGAVEGSGVLVAVDPATSQEWRVAENSLYFE